MSGRDWKRLIANHRGVPFHVPHVTNDCQLSSVANEWTCRCLKTFSKVDYDDILASIEKEKEKSKTQMLHMKKLKQQCKESKNTSNLKEHQKAWCKMNTILNKQVTGHQLEIEKWRSHCILNDESLHLKDFLLEVIELYNTQQLSQMEFKQDSYRSITDLKREFRKLQNMKRMHLPTSFVEDILNEIHKVCEEKERVWSLLEEEWSILSANLQSVSNELLPWKQEDTIEGVPKEVWTLDCPSIKLQEMMSEEFIKLDRHYKHQLHELFVQFEPHIKLTNGGWDSDNDRTCFELVYNQYSQRQKRSLLIDRLIRELPHKSREEIILYETWYHAVNYYKNQRKVLMSCWKDKKDELLKTTHTCYTQAIEDWNSRKLLQKKHDEFTEICKKLANKVSEWRIKCLATQKEEAELADKEFLCQQAMMEEEERKQRERNRKIKEKLIVYHSQKEEQQQVELAREKERFDRFSDAILEQKKKNKERIGYRTNLHQLKLQKQQSERDHFFEENKKKEENLEKIRKLVRIEAEIDPARLSSDTKSSKAHSTYVPSDFIQIQQPLFPLHSFTSDKICADKRFKVATALNEAGLLSSDYARKVLASVPPPLQPRPDQNSSLFK